MYIDNQDFFNLLQKIQSKNYSAEQIAILAVDAINIANTILYNQFIHIEDYKNGLTEAKEKLLACEPNQPTKANALDFILDDYELMRADSMKALYALVSQKISQVKEHFATISESIAKLGNEKITKNMNIFTFSYSSTIINIFKKAKEKNIKIHITQGRPALQGKKMAQEVSELGIKTIMYADLGIRQAIKESDVILLGCDAIDSHLKFYNDIGSELICEIAHANHIPIYICTDTWKFDSNTHHIWHEMMEPLPPQQIWDEPPKNVEIKNYAFEKIDPTLITGVICEEGILTLDQFLNILHEKKLFN